MSERTVGAYEAKTHLPALLDEAERGVSITITKRGRPVARLVPVHDADSARRREAIEAIKKERASRDRVPVAEILSAIQEGRR